MPRCFWNGSSRPWRPKGALPPAAAEPRQALLWKSAPYLEEAPAINSVAELSGAIEHLQYAVFRRYNNQVTRAERARLENTIDNALFKVDRFLLHAGPWKSGRSRMKFASFA